MISQAQATAIFLLPLFLLSFSLCPDCPNHSEVAGMKTPWTDPTLLAPDEGGNQRS